MADDKEMTMLEDGEEAEGSEAKGLGDKKKLIMFGGIGLGAVVIGVVLALFVVKPMMSGSSDEASEDNTEEVIAAEENEPEESKKADKKKKKSSKSSGSSMIYSISNIVVNPAGTGGSRFLSCSIAFELANSELHDEFGRKEALVRDALITILSSRTVPQLTVPKQREIVRYQIKKRLEQLMKSDDLVGVYFTDFVLQ
jgi:flagellar FliL protein